MRRGLGLTMAELASQAKVSERWICELEHGRARPSDGMCERLAAGLLPDCVRTVQAMTDLRFQRLAGASLHRWERRRPRRESVARAYERAAAKLDEHEQWRRQHSPTFLEALDEGLAAAVERAGR